jgi:hypothetical protein
MKLLGNTNPTLVLSEVNNHVGILIKARDNPDTPSHHVPPPVRRFLHVLSNFDPAAHLYLMLFALVALRKCRKRQAAGPAACEMLRALAAGKLGRARSRRRAALAILVAVHLLHVAAHLRVFQRVVDLLVTCLPVAPLPAGCLWRPFVLTQSIGAEKALGSGENLDQRADGNLYDDVLPGPPDLIVALAIQAVAADVRVAVT